MTLKVFELCNRRLELTFSQMGKIEGGMVFIFVLRGYCFKGLSGLRLECIKLEMPIRHSKVILRQVWSSGDRYIRTGVRSSTNYMLLP